MPINKCIKVHPRKDCGLGESLPNKVDAYLNEKVGKTCQEYSALNESLNTR
jgi:hypothetical protein